VTAYVITQPWTDEVLLIDGAWGDYERYWETAWTSTSLVRANRRAIKLKALVCQILEPSPEDALEDSPKLPTPPESSAQPSLSVPRSHGLF